MTKKCTKCGFDKNPEGAHYCGKCGTNIASYGHVWKTYDSSKYSTYVSSGNTVISNSRLNELRRYERKAKDSFWIKVKETLGGFWEGVKEGVREDKWEWIIYGVIILGVIVFLLFSGCEFTNEKKLTRIEVDGKYGIGYDKDHMLVPAEYASISEQPMGKNQWQITDPATGLEGVAYVTDSLCSVIQPEFGDVQIGYGRYSLLRKSPKNAEHFGEYEYVVKEGRILNKEPFSGIKAIGTFNDFVIFLDRQSNDQYQLYDRDLEKIGPVYSDVNISFTEGVLIARGRDESILYDFTGNRLNQTVLHRVKKFSDGVSWAWLTKKDYQNDRISLIDKNGKCFFSVDTYRNSYPVDFSEGIGWYKKTKGVWVAVDKNGKEQFSIGAYSVYPFTMGIAPVYKGTFEDRKLGFVDKTGRTVIPFKYKSSEYYNPTFRSDSTMAVILDGKKGRLHRDGTFSLDN